MTVINQQNVIDIFYDELVYSVGGTLENKIYELNAPDNYTLPLATFSVTGDQDIALLGDGRINNTNIQVSFFGKKSNSIKSLRVISDYFVEYIDGRILENGMTVKVINKGIALINDENIQILTEFLIN